MGDSPPPPAGGPLAIEKVYQKKSQLEHILLRPDTYIGSVEPVTENMWVYDSERKHMVQRDLTYVPGLYKIFDEILVNAADNKQRDKTMDTIKITIEPEENIISIWNNGQGIPVVEHKDEKMFVPTMIFGHLLTSSNYNDEDQKVTGGRNGYGAKLCNIFSTKFTVETSSAEYRKAFKQTWRNNMGEADDVKIKSAGGADYTKVTFSPDLKKFKMEKLDKDIVDLMCRRAYDVAASTRGVKVFLNGDRLPVKNFKDYVDLYVKGTLDDSGQTHQIIYENAGERWEIALTTSDKGFQQVSFVNSIATTKGGRHVDYIADMIVKKLTEVLKKKNKGGMQIKPFQIKSQMWLFINCLIVNPTFDSQTKENMTLQAKSFGSKCNLSEKFFTQVTKSPLVDQILTWAKFKAQTILDKASSGKKKSRLKGIPKLEDANDAGTKNSLQCTLILTEGDSAKALVMSGLAVIGRDRYGVFPLRGKLLNVREASHRQILENAEINNIIKIMGLQHKKKYETQEDMQTLRYGKLMIMTDQDQDGSHIKGLIINFIHFFWPSLIKMNFIEVFITPIVKATKKNDEISFFSIPEFEEWRKETQNAHTYRVKYYKGLGTSTSKEAKEYFSNMERHRIKFKYSGRECDELIIMAFSKKCVEQRKEWLLNWMEDKKRRQELGLPEEYLYTKDTKSVTFKDFINKELVLFSNMDNERAIPSMIDGLKPGSRKILYTCLKRNDKNEVKVAQLAGSVAYHSAYHHGEQSLMSTIINMAQNYVGSNNINLLQPIGQFGTRVNMGKDAASPRYIFTMLSPLTKLIFHPHDDPILKYMKDDGKKVEPVYYVPIIPMVLANGADGIGTGWMTKILNFNPRELIENCKRMINHIEPLIPLKPWYKGFRGDIEALYDNRYVISGEIAILEDDDRIEITELPVGTGTHNYKESVLEPMLSGSDKQPALISDYKEYNTDTTVRFVVTMSKEKLDEAEREGLHKVFKLQTTATPHMVAFDKDGCLRTYATPYDILKEYFEVRMDFYQKRKAFLEGMLEAEANKLTNQARFILEKCSGKLVVENKKRAAMIQELLKNGFQSDPVKAWKQIQVTKGNTEEDDEPSQEFNNEETPQTEVAVVDSKTGPDYDYLLGMTMWTLTLERKEELINKKNLKVAELEALKAKTLGDLWMDDLKVLLEKMDDVEEKERQEERDVIIKLSSKGADKGRKKKMSITDKNYVPSDSARRILPEISAELRKKAENANKAKERKAMKLKKGATGEKDEFDLLEERAQKSVASRIGNSPHQIDKNTKETKKGLKQTKLKFEKASPKKKKKDSPFTDSEDDCSDPDVRLPSGESVSPTRRGPRRQAASNVTFNFDDESESDVFSEFSDSDTERRKKKKEAAPSSSTPKPTKAPSPIDDSDDDLEHKKNDGAASGLDDSDKLFDNLMGKSDGKKAASSAGSDFSDSEKPKSKKPRAKKDDGDKKPKKAPAAKKPAAKKPKKKADSDEDSEENENGLDDSDKLFDDLVGKPQKKAASSAESDGAWSDSEKTKAKKPRAKKAEGDKKPKKAPTEKKPPVKRPKKKADSDEESDDMFSSPVNKSKPKKKKASTSDNEDSDVEFVPLSRQSSGRAKKAVTYTVSDSDSE